MTHTASTHDPDAVRDTVRSRYAAAALREEPCCGPSCCGGETDAARAPDPTQIAAAIGYAPEDLAAIPEDANLGLGCGNPTAIASLREGQVVVDLGSGGGIDCFLAAARVGEAGRVIGVDMTPEMVARARTTARKAGIDNVEFRLGEIEALPVADASTDVVISNCVLNLSPDRPRVLREAYRILRPGGRIVVSDMVSDLPVPEVVAGSLDAVAACLPTPRDEYVREFEDAGFVDVAIEEERPYPADHLLADPGVRAFLDAHTEARSELEAFAASIAGAVITARRP